MLAVILAAVSAPTSRKPAQAGTAHVVLVVLAALAVSACGAGSKHQAVQGRRAPLVSIFEAEQQLLANPSGTLNQLRRLGVTIVRVFIPWSSVAPDANSRKPPAGFDASTPSAYPASGWARFDRVVRAARTLDITVFLTLEGPAPLWATAPGAPPGTPAGGLDWEPSPSAFGGFVRAVGTRYSGRYVPPGASAPLPRVSLWSTWNEPNDGPALAPQAIDDSTVEASAVRYRQLLDVGWDALAATGHRDDTILIGELAPFGQSIGSNVPGTFGEMVPLRFVRALYCVDGSLHPLRGSAAVARGCPPSAAGSKLFPREHPALFDATGFAIHPYPGPTRVAPNTVLGISPDFANLAALPRLEQLLQVVTSAYGHRREFMLWNTEDGYITDPPYPPGAPLALAAEYENWAEYISWRYPWIHSWDHYLLVDPPVGGPSHFFSGLRFSNGTPKPTYAAFRMPIYLPRSSQSGADGLEVWGCVRPVYYQSSPQRVEIQLQPLGRGPFKPVRTLTLTDSSCYFDVTIRFPSGGNVRLAWSYPHGPMIYSRLVTITVR